MRKIRPVLLSALLVQLLAAIASFAQDPNPPNLYSERGAWPIRRQWTPAEVRHYAQWVEHIYDYKTTGSVEQRIAKIERVLTDPQMNLLENPAFLGQGGNPQLSPRIIRAVHSMIDCAKLTAFMPAYYAYRRALPWVFTFVWSPGADVRSADFTYPSGQMSSFDCPSLEAFFIEALGGVSSGNYRVQLYGKNAEWSDSLPVAISRRYLLPGAVNYTDGHCLLLAKVDDYGDLHFLNCSTTPTRDIFTYNGMNTIAGITPQGYSETHEFEGCFQGLRVLRYPIAETDRSGRVIRVRRRTNAEMQEFGFSTEQYALIQQIYDNQFISEGPLRCESFHDLIRWRMKKVDRVAPLKFLNAYASELEEVYRLREEFIQDAWGDVLKNGPITYPEECKNENIFQALGRWETWSSPSSDVDRRNKYFYLADWCDYAIRCFGVMPGFVDLTGLEKYSIRSQADLAHALMQEKRRLFAQHAIEYTNAQGKKVKLTLQDIEQRLYDLSFDPNHPPELRWGAPPGSPERAAAPQMFTPVPSGERVPMEDGYRWQRFYRCLSERQTEMSLLRGMFTEGFPLRDKFDQQLTKWARFETPVSPGAGQVASSGDTAGAPKPKPPSQSWRVPLQNLKSFGSD